MSARTIPFVTHEEYLEFDRTSDINNEYVFGEIVAMAGGTPRHARITGNATVAIGKRLWTCMRDIQFEFKSMSGSPVALRVSRRRGRLRTSRVLGDQSDTITNPNLVFEILSPTTRDYDLGRKLRIYMRIPSLQEIAFVAQERVWVEHWRRMPNHRWKFDVIEDRAASLKLGSAGFRGARRRTLLGCRTRGRDRRIVLGGVDLRPYTCSA